MGNSAKNRMFLDLNSYERSQATRDCSSVSARRNRELNTEKRTEEEKI